MTKEDNKAMDILVNNVLFYRVTQNISQQKLSRLIGKPDDYIERLESFKLKRVPDLFTSMSIAMALGIEFDLLLQDNSIIEKIVNGG